jgi:hypothetical protein
MLEKLFHFEEENNDLIKNSRLNGFAIWDTIRVQFYMNSLNIKMPKVSSLQFKKIEIIFSFIRSVKTLFQKYDVVLITSSSEKKIYNSVVYDKSISGICSSLKGQRVLVIDYSFGSKKLAFGFENVVNGYLMNFLAKCIKPFCKISFNDDSLLLLDSLKKEDNFDYKNYLISINALNKIFFFFLKFWSPKIYFASCYSYYSSNYSANKLNIPTYEIQHGIITNAHPAYSSKISDNSIFRCKNLLAYGDSIFSFLTSESIFKKKNILVVGNAYIDQLKNINRNHVIDNHNKIVIVPTDWSVEDYLIDFVIEMVKKTEFINFIITPRIELSIDNYKRINGFFNRINVRMNQFQSQVQNSDVCLTIDSTCALEACALGIPSILYDLDNRATNFFGHVFNDQNIVKYINSSKEAVNIIENWPFLNKNYIKSAGNFYYKENYYLNINSVING